MNKDEFPSLKQKPKPPVGWIQWKGTSICCDIDCLCGERFHFDGDFMYHVKCSKCGQVYECSGFFKLIPLDFEPEGTIELQD